MTSRWIIIFLLVPFYLGLTACPASGSDVTATGDIPPAAPQATKAATIPDDPDPALWVIKDDDTTIYLFGTVHILKPGLTWFDDAVKDAFDRSEELVIEMIQPDQATMAKIVGELAVDKTGVSLRDKLSDDDRADYEAAMVKLKMPVASFDPLEPWFASVTMSLIPLLQNGYDVNQGVEKTLTASAKMRKMKIIGLETPEQQLGFFDNLPEDVQIRFLNFTVDSIDEMADGIENMVAHWANANVNALGELMSAGLEEKILYDTLLTGRNANWAVWVEQRMKQPGTVFLAVGAGHLTGKGSLQEQLEPKGLSVKRIEY